jgi:hypothetical protein
MCYHHPDHKVHPEASAFVSLFSPTSHGFDVGVPMAGGKTREFECGVVNEKVKVCLCSKPSAGLRSKQSLFVKCDQDECQYADENKLPCTLSLSMFEEEIRVREEKARLRREESEYR